MNQPVINANPLLALRSPTSL